MNKKSPAAMELMVGGFVLVGIALLLTMIVLFGELDELRKEYYTVSGIFEDVQGIKEGAPVNMSGVQIGEVQDIDIRTRAHKQFIHVKMKIDGQYSIKEDSKLMIAEKGVLGEKYLDFSIGTAESPVLPHDGSAEIRGMIAPSLADFSDIGRDIAEKMDPVLAESHQFLENLNRIVGDAQFQENTKKTMSNIALASEALPETLALYKTLADDLRKGAADMQSLTHAWQAVGIEGREQLALLGGHVEESAAALHRLLAQANQIADHVSSGEGNLGKLLFEDALYRNLTQTIQDLADLAAMIKEDPTMLLFGPKKDKTSSSRKTSPRHAPRKSPVKTSRSRR